MMMFVMIIDVDDCDDDAGGDDHEDEQKSLADLIHLGMMIVLVTMITDDENDY